MHHARQGLRVRLACRVVVIAGRADGQRHPQRACRVDRHAFPRDRRTLCARDRRERRGGLGGAVTAEDEPELSADDDPAKGPLSGRPLWTMGNLYSAGIDLL
mgnify:CR=1 FL=1